MMEERRAHPRHETKLAVVLYVDRRSIVARARDISLGGIGVRLDTPLEDGIELNISFHLVTDGKVEEDSPRLAVDGHVMWSVSDDTGAYDVGIRFGSLDAMQKALLGIYIDRLEEGVEAPD